VSGRVGETGRVAYQLRCTVTGQALDPCFLRERDAVAALGGSELLVLHSDWATGKAEFGSLRTLADRRRPVFHRYWQTLYAPMLVRQLMDQFHAGRLPS
jgi:hypothetical protein